MALPGPQLGGISLLLHLAINMASGARRRFTKKAAAHSAGRFATKYKKFRLIRNHREEPVIHPSNMPEDKSV